MANSQYCSNIKTNIDPYDKYILTESDKIYNNSNMYAEYLDEISHLSTLGHFRLHEIEQATHIVYSMTPVLRSHFKPLTLMVYRQQNISGYPL